MTDAIWLILLGSQHLSGKQLERSHGGRREKGDEAVAGIRRGMVMAYGLYQSASGG